MRKQPLLVICGPTASGKTALSIKLAQLYNGEIISADSMQIYKGMDIATAKPTEKEMENIPHHLISFLENDVSFSVADYVNLARKEITQVSKKGNLPIVVGGTGLYINSLIDNIKFDDTCSNTKIRNELFSLAEQKGNKFLLDMLMEFDPQTALALHENNLNRIVRAIEVYRVTGKTISQQKQESRREESPYNPCIIGLTFKEREKLYERINLRVDKMIELGLIDEAKQVFENSSLSTANQAIGYKELIPYFKGEKTLESCIDNLKQQTRRYAKRQLTWFRRDERIEWIYLDEITNFEDLLNKAKKILVNWANI